MKAMVLKGIRNTRLEEVEKPEPGFRDVIIKVAYCGICKTDVHIYSGVFPVKTPVILGHEFSGIVSEVGKEVSRVDAGDHVAVNPIIYCGECKYCVSGRTNLCENALVIGGAGRVVIDGAYAQYVKVPEKNFLKFNKEASLKHAALTEPLACVVHRIKLAKIKPATEWL